MSNGKIYFEQTHIHSLLRPKDINSPSSWSFGGSIPFSLSPEKDIEWSTAKSDEERYNIQDDIAKLIQAVVKEWAQTKFNPQHIYLFETKWFPSKLAGIAVMYFEPTLEIKTWIQNKSTSETAITYA